MMKNYCLTIAGADPTSGAGIQADIRTFDRCGVHPFSVITAITFQTATKFFGYKSLSDDLRTQLDAIFSEYPVKFVKIGMIPDLKALDIIIEYIKKYDLFVVYDPVSISSAGKRLSINGLELEIEKRLFKNVMVITPNLSEALSYSKINYEIYNLNQYKKIGNILLEMLFSDPLRLDKEKAVVIKSFDLDTEKIGDLAIINKETKGKFNVEFNFYEKLRIHFHGNIHGSGCVFSSAIASFLSKGYNVNEAIASAEQFFDENLQNFIVLPDQGKVLNLTLSKEKMHVINQIKEIYNFVSKNKKFSKVIPEVRTNISGSLPNATKKEDVAGIEGRITIINDYPHACGEIKFGASDHTARLLLSAKQFDNSINFVINLKYDPNWIKAIKESTKLQMYEIHRERQPEAIKGEEFSTMHWLIKDIFSRVGKIPDIIWDKGEIGKEPMLRLFGKNSADIIRSLEKIIECID